MSNDPENIHHPLETELACFTPAKFPAGLRQRIADELVEVPLTGSDRALVTFSAVGAMAAGLILFIVICQLNKPEPPRATAQEIAFQKRVAAEYQQLLAAK